MNFNSYYKFVLYFPEVNPMPTEDITTHFNELRTDIVLLYELKLALATCDYELETLKHQYEVLNPGKVGNIDVIDLKLVNVCLNC